MQIKSLTSCPRFVTWKTALVLVGIAIGLVQILKIHQLWTSVGYVDTWPLYDRLMRFMTGELSLDHYLFDPHVHPHSIVYFLYLIDVTLGTGRQLIPHYASIFSVVALAITLVTFLKKLAPVAMEYSYSSSFLLAAIFVILPNLSEATVIPFQTVVITTRFLYILLLATLIYCHLDAQSNSLHFFTLVVSAIAATFYASGGVFAAEVLLLHLLFFRRWIWAVLSALPLAAYFTVIAMYTAASAETDALKKILGAFNFDVFVQTIVGASSYYASVFVAGWPYALTPNFDTSEIFITGLGFILMSITTTWAVYILICQFAYSCRNQTHPNPNSFGSLLMALIAISISLSAISASLLWLARAEIFGPAMGVPAHFATLTSSRYAAFSGLALIVLFYIIATAKRRRVGGYIAGALFLFVAAFAINSINSQKMSEYISARDKIENSATALMLGMSPADREGNAVFPGVENDWHWPKQLPKVVTYLRIHGLSFAYMQPALGTRSTGEKMPIVNLSIENVIERPEFCKLTGTRIRPVTLLAEPPQRFKAITNEDDIVVGYASLADKTLNGHIICAAARSALYLDLQY